MNTVAALTTALQAGRIAVGLAAVAAPAQLGRTWVGRVAERPDAQVMTRAFGIRDVALGAATLGALHSAGTDGVGFRVLTGLGVAVDAVDLASAATAGDDIPAAGQTMAIAGVAALSGAAILGLTAREQDD